MISKSDIVTIEKASPYYPKEWQELSSPPAFLQAVGNIELLRARKFTLVGSRKTPAAAMKVSEGIARDLTDAFVLVTGAADGGDTSAIEGALASGRIICVLAGGFGSLPQGNIALLERVAQKGLLISPHPYDTPVRAFSYEYRNKLLAALGEGTLVVGADEKSGALITAKYAQKAGKPVFALPYPPNALAGAGCNALIKKGAYLTESAEDIFEKTGVDRTVKAKTLALSPDEEKTLCALRELTEGHINEIAAKSGVPAFKARAVLSSLEVKGLAVAIGGNRYSPV